VMNEIKDDFSGPNMMVGSPDDKPIMSPGGLTVGLARAQAAEESPAPREALALNKKTAQATDPRTPTGAPAKKCRWVTAVFWSELNLYGHTIATKKA